VEASSTVAHEKPFMPSRLRGSGPFAKGAELGADSFRVELFFAYPQQYLRSRRQTRHRPFIETKFLGKDNVCIKKRMILFVIKAARIY
jgi:hypothetical protein